LFADGKIVPQDIFKRFFGGELLVILAASDDGQP
jgi:hypothetical protein